jgi:hypothetical protein
MAVNAYICFFFDFALPWPYLMVQFAALRLHKAESGLLELT